MKKSNTFAHALNMVIKNKRSYLMLSITILLSFMFFLSYLIYIDSNNMSKYGKDIYSDKNIIEAMCPIGENNEIFDVFIKSLGKIKDTHYYIWKDAYADDSIDDSIPNYVIVMPKSVWGVQDDLYNRIFISNNKQMVLNKNQAIVSKDMYRKLKKQFGNEKIILNYPIKVEGNKKHILKLEVIDGCYTTNIRNLSDNSSFNNTMFISYDTLKEIDYCSLNRHIFIYSKHPDKVVESMRNLEVAGESTYENKLQAFGNMCEKIKLKQIIAVVLFIILAINLYSSFKNALNDRTFEIGVKRAIGASKLDIVKQFLYEGIIVVAFNVLISTIFTSIIFCIYKSYLCLVLRKEFIIYISFYSIVIFLIVSVFMTVIFSLIFAIQSSRIEIIKNLKSE